MIPITRGRLLPAPPKTAMLTPLSAAGFMRCGAAGVPMSEDDGMVEDIHNGTSSGEIMMPSEDKLLFAERIFARLNPPSIPEIPAMIHKRAKIVGGIFFSVEHFSEVFVRRPSGGRRNEKNRKMLSWFPPI